MKKMTLKKLFGGICCAAMAMFAVSCAQGVEDETWTAGVSGVQLESPAADSFTYSIVTDATGTEQVKIQWPIVVGAGGYLCSVWNVNDPANPEVLVDNETIDGAALYFPLAEDSSYKISVQTLGNAKLNNAAAAEATEYAMNTMIEGIPVPVTEDLGAFISKYIADNADVLAAQRASDPNFEIAFDLEPGATYQMAAVAECDLQPTRIRGDRQNKPAVMLTNNAYFETAGGLKIKFINIDASGLDKEKYGVITLKQNPNLELGKESSYHLTKPIRIEGCWVKEVLRGFYSHGPSANWAVYEFRMSDCIVQVNCKNNAAHKSFLYPYGGGKGQVLNIYLSNSTIYNVYDPAAMSSSAYFIQFGYQKGFAKAFGTANGIFSIQNCTLNRMTPNKDFGNRVGYEGTSAFQNTIFYDTYNIHKVLSRGCTKVLGGNILFCPTKGVAGDDSKNGYGEVLDPGFTTENLNKVLDFSQPNGGVNFAPVAGVTAGDPRWLK
ncbi:MAG: DUF4957 domain-containing protein [Alistipes sp.]|nr:DUF4957 domain-containing protein [Alistipes sp.]